MLAVIFRAAQARFLRRHRQKKRRAARLFRQHRPGARDLENHRATRRIVGRAVVNRIAVDRRSNAQMIPMRAENHRFVLQLRIAALDFCDHVASVNFANFRRHASAKAQRQRESL